MKSKLLVAIILVLLVSNITLLFFYFNKTNNRDKGRGRMKELFRSEVGFSEEQVEKFEAIRKEQRELIKPMFDTINMIRNNCIEALLKGLNEDSLQLLYTNKLSRQMLNIDKTMYAQFRAARKICTPNQYQAYDSAIKKIMTRIPDRGPQKNK